MSFVTIYISSADKTGPLHLVFGDIATREGAPGTPHRQVVEAAYWFVHPDYTTTGYEDYTGVTVNDLALVRFVEPVKFTDYVRPACVSASADEVEDYEQCHVAGWGAETDEGKVLERSKSFRPTHSPKIILKPNGV